MEEASGWGRLLEFDREGGGGAGEEGVCIVSLRKYVESGRVGSLLKREEGGYAKSERKKGGCGQALLLWCFTCENDMGMASSMAFLTVTDLVTSPALSNTR